jgi:hypothetical protein
VTSAEKAGVKVLEAFATWFWRWIRPDISSPALNRHSEILAAAVRERESLLYAQLGGGPNMVIGALRFEAQIQSSELGAGNRVGVLDKVSEYFRRQAIPRLVVLGDAGAGKTVTVVRFVCDQLEHRATLPKAVRADQPVPVRVNAAGWDGGTEFSSWMASQLAIDYRLNPRVARAMVDRGHILPVLDGLDEMDAPQAEPALGCATLDRLNRVPWRDRPVVVSCRTKAYEAMELRSRAGLEFATTVTLQSLPEEEARSYLEKYRKGVKRARLEWAPVFDQLDQSGGVLATALGTPWLPSLTAVALKHGGHRVAVELAACRDTTEIRDRLFESLIPAAIDATPDARRATYTALNVERWLRTLAQHLELRRATQSGGAQLTLEQVSAIAGTRRCRVLHTLVAGLLVLLLAGFPFGFARGLRFGLAEGLKWELLGGIVFGIWAVLYVALLEDETAAERWAWRVPGLSRWRRGVAWGLGFGVASAVGAWVAVAEFRVSLPLVLGVAFAAPVTIGISNGLDTNSEERLVLGQDADRIIHNDLVTALAKALMYGLISGCVLVLILGTKYGITKGFSAALIATLPMMLGLGIAFGVATGRYAVASLLFGVTGIFPARPTQFLEWARNVGLLRVTGIAYQFRHDTYGEWLVAGGADRNATAGSVAASEAGSA